MAGQPKSALAGQVASEGTGEGRQGRVITGPVPGQDAEHGAFPGGRGGHREAGGHEARGGRGTPRPRKGAP